MLETHTERRCQEKPGAVAKKELQEHSRHSHRNQDIRKIIKKVSSSRLGDEKKMLWQYSVLLNRRFSDRRSAVKRQAN